MATEVLNLNFNDGALPEYAYRSGNNFTASSGKLKTTSDLSSGWKQILFETGVTDCLISVVVNAGGLTGGDATTAVRGKIGGSHIGVSVLPKSSTSADTALYAYDGTSYTELTLGPALTTFSSTGDVLVEIALTGDVITVVFNGEDTLTYTTTFNNDGTLVGLSAKKQAVSIDNLVVTSESEPTSGVVENSYKIVWDGDSRTQGEGSTPFLPITDRVRALLTPSPADVNFGVGGQQTSDAQLTFNSNVIPSYDENKEFNIYVINGFGINDCRLGRTSSEIISSLLDLAERAKAVGYYVLIATIPPRGDGNASIESTRLAVNSWIMSNVETSIDLRYDLNSDNRIGTWDSAYYSDVDHLNYEGQDIWAENISIAIANEFSGLSTSAVPENQPPTANAGPDQSVAAGVRVQLNGLSSTLGASFNWYQVSGSPVNIKNSNTATPSFTSPAVADAGAVVIGLTVELDGLVSAESTVTINYAAFSGPTKNPNSLSSNINKKLLR